jgi:hypothetical protein
MQDFTIGDLLIERQEIVCIWRLVRKLRAPKTRFPAICCLFTLLAGWIAHHLLLNKSYGLNGVRPQPGDRLARIYERSLCHWVEEMGVARIEAERELLLRAKALCRLDASDERMGVTGQVEMGFGSQWLDDFYYRLHSAFQRRVGRSRIAFNMFRPNAEDDLLAGAAVQGSGRGFIQKHGDGIGPAWAGAS